MRPFHHAEYALSTSAQAIQTELAHRDVHPASADEILEVRALAARRIGSRLVQPDSLRMVHERSGAALFVTRGADGVTGVLAVILLSLDGLVALQNERLDGLAPDPAHVVRIGEEPAGVYVWGIAALRRMAGARLQDGLLAMAEAATPHLAYFARAATPIGEHLSQRYGFRPYPGSTTGLLRRDPAQSRRVAA